MRPEQVLHQQVVQLLTLFEQAGELTYFHPPNGGVRSKVEAAIFKTLGVKPGVPDLLVWIGKKHLQIELKAEQGRVSPTQREWAARMERHGVEVWVCRSLDDVRDLLKENGLQA